MLDNEGPIEVAWQGPACHQLSEDHTVDFVIRELQHCDISVAALQETKRFGTAAYMVGRSTVLAAGRPTPPAGTEHAERRVWGCRIVRATLSAGKKASEQLHVFSCYALTFEATRDLKEAVYDDLVDEIPACKRYIVYHTW